MSKSNETILKLGCDLRTDLISTFTKLSALIVAKSAKTETKKELVKMISSLCQRLSALLSKDNESNLKKNLSIIDENLVKDIKNEYGLSFEISWNTRRDIIDLLLDNFNSVLLTTDSDFDNKNLLDDNNYVIHLLTDLEAKPFSENFALQSQLKGENRSKEETDIDQITHRLKNNNEKIAYLLKCNEELTSELMHLNENLGNLSIGKDSTNEKEIRHREAVIEMLNATGLKIRLTEIDTRTKQVAFDFDLINAVEFLDNSANVHSEAFNFFDLVWLFVEAKPNQIVDKKRYVGLYLSSKNKVSDWHQKLSFELKVINPLNNSIYKSQAFDGKIFQKGQESNGSNSFISYERIPDYIEANVIKIEVKIRADEDFQFHF